MKHTELIACTDGASRGNPGPAAIGVVIKTAGGRKVASISEGIGHTTNNQAEYRAVIAALEKVLALDATAVTLKVDSELVVKQIRGLYRVKSPELQPLFRTVTALIRRFDRFAVEYVPREKNREADALANQAFESKMTTPEDDIAVKIRPARPADNESLFEVMHEIDVLHSRNLPQVFRRLNRDDTLRQLENAALDPKMVILVAEHAENIAGFVRMKMSETPDYPVFIPRRYAKINDFGVRESFQRRGVGRALMQAAEKWARDHGAQDIELDVWEFNRAAMNFYLEMGFSGIRRTLWKEFNPPKS